MAETAEPDRTADQSADARTGDYSPPPAVAVDRTVEHNVGGATDGDQHFSVDAPPGDRTGSLGSQTGDDSSRTENFDALQAARQARKLENVRVPGYEVLAELGHGGMGVVYKARDTRLDRTVALKMVLAGIHASDTQLARFVQEAKAVAQVQHPNIVQIYEINEAEGLPYFSLEFVDGGGLDARTDHKPQPPAFAAEMVETLARAMQYAHDRGIVHRDLKPANVLLTRDGRPKIADFGLAKKQADASQTQAGQVMGTPNFMAPEQARGDVAAIGPASDQYALGGILYEMLTGRPPFNGASVVQTLDMVRTQEPVAPSHLNPATPRDLETVCLKALQKDPARRYASCGALADDLRRYLNGEPIQARPVGPAERAVRWARRNPAVAALGTGVAVLLVAVTAVSAVSAVTVSRKNSELVQKNADLDASIKLAVKRGEDNRTLLQTLVNEIPERLKGAIYSEKVQKDVLDLLTEVRVKSEQADDQHRQARADQVRHLRQGELLTRQRKFSEAVAELEKALKIGETVRADNPKEKDKSDGNVAASLAALGDAYILQGDTARGREFYDRALTLRRAIVQTPQTGELTPAEARIALAATLVRMADTLAKSGQHADAIRSGDKALAVFAEVPEDELTGDGRQSRAAGLGTLGRSKFLTGDPVAGREFFDRALAEMRSLVKDHRLNLHYQQYLAQVGQDAGTFELLHAGDPVRARAHYEAAYAIRTALVHPTEILRCQLDQSQAAYLLATAALRAGDRPAAEKLYRVCMDVRQAVLNVTPDDNSVKFELMLAQARAGKHQEATATAGRLEKAAREQLKDPPVKAVFFKRAAFGFALSAYGVAVGHPGMLPPDVQKQRQAYLDRAFAAMDQAVANGYRNATELETDPDFDPLRDDPRFAALLAKVK